MFHWLVGFGFAHFYLLKLNSYLNAHFSPIMARDYNNFFRFQCISKHSSCTSLV